MASENPEKSRQGFFGGFFSRYIPYRWRRTFWPDPDDSLGTRGEKLAAHYLARQGYRIVAHGHRQRLGEIDLIAIKRSIIVFVEVKTWRSDRVADPSEAVNRAKQQRITRAALIYLKEKNLLECPARMDVISIVWPEQWDEYQSFSVDAGPAIRHIENAFEATGTGQMFS